MPNPNNYRQLYRIAKDIRQHWRNVNFAAKPYLQAMDQLNRIEDSYGQDSARSVVMYFLVNSQTWKGDAARRVKAELRAMLDGKPVPAGKPAAEHPPTDEEPLHE